MGSEEQIIERLDRLIAIVSLAYGEEIGKVRVELRADSTAAGILDLVGDEWIESGDIKRSVSKSAGVSEKTVQRSLSILSARGVLRSSGSGPHIKYKSAGVL